jgi:hypothetical protein
MEDYKGYQGFTLGNGFDYFARQLVDGVLIDPKLPRGFDNTPNEQRQGQTRFWGVPFIVTSSVADLNAYYAARTDKYAAESLKRRQAEGRANWM